MHYFNAPPDCTEDQLKQVFRSLGGEVPIKQATFSKSKSLNATNVIEYVVQRENSDFQSIVIMATAITGVLYIPTGVLATYRFYKFHILLTRLHLKYIPQKCE